MRALSAAQHFVRTQMTASDLIAIMSYNGAAVKVLQDFTADRNRLLSILETMVVGEGQEFAEAESDAASSDTGAAFGQDDSEFNIFNTDRQLSALQTAAKMLGLLSEKKSLLYFASFAPRWTQPFAPASPSGPSTHAAWLPTLRWATPRKARLEASACTPALPPSRSL